MSAPHNEISPLAGGLKGNTEVRTDLLIIPAQAISCKDFDTLRAKFVLLGHTLQRNRRADDGRTTYSIARAGQARHFTHTHDVHSFLVQIGGAK